MGLFGSTEIYVSSTVQNLAGDVADRPDYMKTVTISAVLSGADSIADTLRDSYIKGPGIKLRNFFNWSLDDDNFGKIGVPGQILYGAIDLDGDTIAAQITAQVGKTCTIQSSSFGIADYTEWSDQYMLSVHPDLLETEWTSDISEAGQITITYADGSLYAFTPADFDKTAKYIYANYLVSEGSQTGTVTQGDTVVIGSDAFPDTTSYTLQSDTTTANTETLTTTVVTTYSYSDGRPNETNTTTSSDTDTGVTGTKVWENTTYIGTTNNILSDDSTKNRVDIYNQFYTYSIGSTTTTETTTTDLGGGVTRTNKIDTTVQTIVVNNSYRMDERIDILQSWVGPYIFIYKYGSGNTVLDGLIEYEDTSTDKEFFPFIPLRLDNHYITEIDSDAAEECRQALKKAVGGDMDEVLVDINDSANVADIDYAYAVFGVSLNVTDNSCKKYIYKFLQRLMTYQTASLEDYTDWKTKMAAYQTSLTAWLEWKTAQDDLLSSLFGQEEPQIVSYPVLPSSLINIGSSGQIPSNYDINLRWQTIAETSGTGLAKADAQTGDLWFEQISSDAHYDTIYYNGGTITANMGNTDHGRLYWQTSDTTWVALDIYGLFHQNYIYGGKSVDTGFFDALNDSEDSGFIIPLHAPTYKAMSIKDMTQMSTACTFMMFNCYVVKKTGLLGSLFLKIFLIVVIIAVVVFLPQLAPSLVQAAAATGAALGLSGVTALIVGAAVNAITGMIVASLLQKGLVAVFGDKLGSILGAIITISAVVYGGTNGFKDFSNITTELTKADNLMKITSAVGNGISGVITALAKDKLSDISALTTEYNSEENAISEDYADYVGTDLGKIDPMILLGSDSTTTTTLEDPDTFFERTLMTGSDIANFSLYMVEKFTDYTLSLDLP